MCQLLGMNCNVPTDVTFSFTGFAQRGGKTDHHTDGWGIAFLRTRGFGILWIIWRLWILQWPNSFAVTPSRAGTS